MGNKRIRILVADDEENIISGYEQSFAELAKDGTEFVPTFCNQGNQAVKKAIEAEKAQDPYEVVFLDIRMPPGMDGVATAKEIRRISPRSQIVMVTASDVEPYDIAQKVPPLDKIMYQSKPFHPAEISHLTMVLSAKYHLEAKLKTMNQKLEAQVENQYVDIMEKNNQIKGSTLDTTHILDALPCGVIVVKKDKTILEANAEALKLLSFATTDELSKAGIDNILEGDASLKDKNGKSVTLELKKSKAVLKSSEVEVISFFKK